MSTPALNHFDRAKPFYPLVMDFMAGLYGWLALMSRGVGRAAANASSSEELPTTISDDVPIRELAAAARIASVIRPLALTSRAQGQPIEIDHDELADESFEQFPYLTSQIPRAAEHLLVLAWETTHQFRITDTQKRDPLWQFLRHCRNAGGHGGRFNFWGDEPRHRAAWGTLEITAALHGTRLFDGPATRTSGPDDLETGLLAPGDALALLWDIEQAFPQLTVGPENDEASR